MFRLKLVLAFLLLCVGHSAPADTKSSAEPATKARDGWPGTRCGELGRGWVRAFSTGDSAMREFYLREMDPEVLAKKSMGTRIENYRKLRERLGRLTLGAVIREAPNELVVTLLDSDAASHEFTFTAQGKSPFKLVSVSFKDKRHGFGGFHH